MSYMASPGPDLISPAGTKPSNASILLQIGALVLAGPAVLLGVFGIYTALLPGPCGDWSGLNDLGVVECWVGDAPIGLLILVIGYFVKKGSPRLRRICIVTSLVVLSLPMIASVLLHRSHCP